jgi:hypothetical protein
MEDSGYPHLLYSSENIATLVASVPVFELYSPTLSPSYCNLYYCEAVRVREVAKMLTTLDLVYFWLVLFEKIYHFIRLEGFLRPRIGEEMANGNVRLHYYYKFRRSGPGRHHVQWPYRIQAPAARVILKHA